MNLNDYFDAVIMLTWSDWKTEPRSNRYHYATRFAKEMPVLFVQPWANVGESIRVENTGIPNIEIVHMPNSIGEHELQQFLELLRERGIRRPLLWIYNPLHFHKLIASLPLAFRVYHATEDYFIQGKGWGPSGTARAEIVASVVQTLSNVDFLIAVTAGVLSSYRQHGGYRGPATIVENGCDANFYFRQADSVSQQAPLPHAENRPIAIYQGGINNRLDFDLLNDVVDMLPEWDFWFCGNAVHNQAGWEILKSKPNVNYLGALDCSALGERMCLATVGLIPFHQDDLIRISLPLKAYEYVACGLPVVSVPINALQKDAAVFSFAENAVEFAAAIRNSKVSRNAPEMLMRRRETALHNSYDERFCQMQEHLIAERKKAGKVKRKLNVAVLFDDRSLHINTIREHVEAFKKYSHHTVYFVPVTYTEPVSHEELARQIDLTLFDVLIVHYTVRMSLSDHLAEGFARQIERHVGLKILFIQDEYENTELARRWFDRLKFDVVYTCVPEKGREYVYPANRFPKTDFLPTLTGYVPEDTSLDDFAKPMRERSTLIGYRGRQLPYIYGTLGYEKFCIGVDVRRLAQERGVAVDIETDDSKRIYGTGWYQFLGSVRATLGTESGSNVFDFDGTLPKIIRQVLDENPSISFEELHRAVLAEHEGHVTMNQISPKIFEAIRLRTALVLFEGSYSGVVEAGVHYIPLKKDYSNIDEVFSKLQDVDYLEALTKRAYDDVIDSGKYSYKQFVENVDRDIDARVIRDARYELFATPVLARNNFGEIKRVFPSNPLGFALNSLPLDGLLQREQVASLLTAKSTAIHLWQLMPDSLRKYVNVLLCGGASLAYRAAKRIWHTLPISLRTYVNTRIRSGLVYRAVRHVWRSLPFNLRTYVNTLFR